MEKVWIDCWQCGGAGELDWECTCMDDTCCCLEPDAPECNICGGAGGYMVPADSDAARDALG